MNPPPCALDVFARRLDAGRCLDARHDHGHGLECGHEFGGLLQEHPEFASETARGLHQEAEAAAVALNEIHPEIAVQLHRDLRERAALVSMATSWQHNGNCEAKARQLHGNSKGTAWQLHGNSRSPPSSDTHNVAVWEASRRGRGRGRVPGGGTRGATASPSMAPWLSRAEREARGQAERETTSLRSTGGLAVSRRRPPRRRRPGLSAGAAGYPVGSPRVPRRSDGGRAIRFWTRGERAVVPRRPNGDRSDAGRVIRSSPS